jgi:hypothetical protein
MKLVFNPAKAATLLIFSTLILITACKKETSGNSDEEFASQASSQADAESEFIFNEIFDNVMGVNNDVGMAGVGVFGQMSSGVTGGTARTNACPDVTVARPNYPDPFPIKIVMDFGTGCAGRDGRFRSGKIIVVYTNRLTYPGAKATTTFESYQVDSIKVQGTHIITNQSIVTTPNTSIIHIWKVVVEGAKLTKLNGNYTEWNSTKTIAQVEGMNTIMVPLDDIYKITGNANGKVKRGDLLIAWKAEITEPLIKKFSCKWIVKGVLKVVRLNLSSTSKWVAVLNYGDGTCDKKAIATINGVVHEITLP